MEINLMKREIRYRERKREVEREMKEKKEKKIKKIW